MTRCSICDHSCRLVPPDGPEPCEWLFIGEKPGQQEDHGGRPFIGDSGREFNQNYLSLAGLERDAIRITNTVKCRLGGNNNKPTPEQIRGCASHHIAGEIRACYPSVIVLLGSTAGSLVPSIELDKEHGIPRWLDSNELPYFGGWEGWVIPMFHPASGLHDTGMMIPLLEDFERIRKWLAGKWEPPNRDYEPNYYIAEGLEIASLLRASETVALDTEDDCGKPWSIQCSVKAGKAALVRMGDQTALQALREYLPRHEVIMHNAPHDLGVLDQLGIHITHWRDTMQEAYHLGNLPQGLKALSYRLLGIRMQSWDDLVTPSSRAKMIDWLTERWMECEPEITTKQLKTKVKILSKPSNLERALKRILSHSHKTTYDLWDQVASLKLSTSQVGTYPLKSISNVPIGEAVNYACQDADVTLQVGMALANLRNQVTKGEWQVDAADWDK